MDNKEIKEIADSVIEYLGSILDQYPDIKEKVKKLKESKK